MNLYNKILHTYGKGTLFSAKMLADNTRQESTVSVQLSVLCKERKIKRHSKGIYYIPSYNPLLGELPVGENDIIKYLLTNKKGYITGPRAYNMLHITNQVPNKTIFAANVKTKKELTTNITLIPSSTYSKEKDTYLLQLLDAITNIKHIPGTNATDAFERITTHVKSLNKKKLNDIEKYATLYPKRTKQTLKTMFTKIGFNETLALI